MLEEGCEEGSGSGASSGASTPEPSPPFTPEFHVRLTDHVTKDGDIVRFTIQVSQNGHTIHVLEREFEDFEYLEHCVTTSQPSHGLIIPPIPIRSAIDPHTAEIQSKRQMGKGSKTLIPDEFHKDCHQLQKYLELLLSHPVFGKSPKLHDFLTIKEAPPRTRVRKGIMSRLSDSLDARKASYPDSEEFFQRERDWVAKYHPALLAASDAFNKMLYAQLRISHQEEQMVTALKQSSLPNQQVHFKQYNSINMVFIECVEALKGQTEDKANKEDQALGSVAVLWGRYVGAEAAMLLERTRLMVDYQACNRALDKAKPNRKDAAEKAKMEAEKAFEECSDVARQEIKEFQRRRVDELQQSLGQYAAHQLTAARTTLATLTKTLAQVKAISL